MVMNRSHLVYDDTPARVFTHYRELEEMGLSAPQVTYIMQYLKEQGLPVSTEIFTLEEAAAEILAHRRELHV